LAPPRFLLKGVEMSLYDLDRIYDRYLEGTSWKRTSGTYPQNNPPCDEAKKIWDGKTNEIRQLILSGVVETDEWCIDDGNWVVFTDGAFLSRSFNVNDIFKKKARKPSVRRKYDTFKPLLFK